MGHSNSRFKAQFRLRSQYSAIKTIPFALSILRARIHDSIFIISRNCAGAVYDSIFHGVRDCGTVMQGIDTP